MSFDDLTQRVGKRNGVSRDLMSDPVALARKHEIIHLLLMLFSGLAIVVIVSALTIGIGETRGRIPAMCGAVIIAGGLMIFYSVQDLRRLYRTRRAKLAPARSVARRAPLRRR